MEDNLVKIGYVKVAAPGGRAVRTARYEDAFFSPLLCESLRREAAASYRLCCCCRADDSAPVSLSHGNGRFIETDTARHSPECAAYLERLGQAFRGSALRGFLPGGRIPVHFGWTFDPRNEAAPLSRDDLSFGERLSLGQLMLLVNIRTMDGRHDGFLVNCWRDSGRQARLFMNGLMQCSLLRRDGELHRVTADDCYSEYTTPVNSTGFLYGKVEGFSAEQVPEEDLEGVKYHDRLWVRVTDPSGRRATVTVNRRDFRSCLYALPFREAVWIFCKVTHRLEKRRDPAARAVPGPLHGTASVRPKPEEARPMLHVSVCRQFVLFNCNDCGMAVFSRDEYDRSNRAALGGAPIYRPLIGAAGSGCPEITEWRDGLPDRPL